MRSVIPERAALRRRLVGVMRLVGLCVALSIGAARSTRAQDIPIPPATPTARDLGVLRPGDILDVSVFRQPELSNKYLIDARGMLQFPGLAPILAAGLDPLVVKDRLTEALRAIGLTNPQISVQPQIRVSILGEIKSPGLYPVEPGTTLLQLVTISGGPVGRADLQRVNVVRDGRRFEVDLAAGLSGSAAGRITLISNDLVVIQRKRGFSREDASFLFGALSAALSVVNIVITLSRR
jgi:protein involved in polysaccharide export with SLBB domain